MSGHTKHKVPACVRQARSVPTKPIEKCFYIGWAPALRRVGRIGIPLLGIPRTTFGFPPMDSLRVFPNGQPQGFPSASGQRQH